MLYAVAWLTASLLQPIYEMDPAAIDAYLGDLEQQAPGYGARVRNVARRCLGTPYARDPLGEGPGGAYDKDPLMDLGRVDCVTFVEQTLALAASDSHQAAQDLLQQIRYHEGRIAFECRNHFMIADWTARNGFCRDATATLGVPVQKLTRTMGRRHFYELKGIPELAAAAQDETLEIAYVASADVAAAEPRLPSPALILLIGKVEWLFTLHCGLYIRDEDGQGRFLNASSTQGKVVTDCLRDVLASERYLGFTAYSIDDPQAYYRRAAAGR